MFGKKDKNIKEEKKEILDIETIPDIFYAGANPVIYQENVKNVATSLSNNGQKEKKKINKKKKIFFLIAFLIFVLIAISIYVVYDYLQTNLKNNISTISENKNTSNQQIDEKQNVSSTENENIEEKTEESEIVDTEQEIKDYLFIDFPPLSNMDTADSDSDKLTDLEEEVFGLDSGAWDSDFDSYFDGQEVENLYNPNGFAPVKIIDSGLVREYINPYYSYRIYYPATWTKAEVDNQAKQAIFSSISGDYISVNVFDKELNQDFYTWFSENSKEQKIGDLLTFVNRFKYKALARRDNLVYYFEDEAHIYVLVYNPRDLGPIKYRNIFKMMSQSFRLSNLENNSLESEKNNLTTEVQNQENTEKNNLDNVQTPVLEENSFI
ncbi:MAG: hypothetical protein WC414_03360 [Patescibacteria group bacterium]